MIDKEAKDGFRANAESGLPDVQAPLLAVTPADVAAVAVPTVVMAGKRKARRLRPALRCGPAVHDGDPGAAVPPGLGSAAGVLVAGLPDARFCRARRQRHVTLSRGRRVRRGRRGRRSRDPDRHAASAGARRSPSRPVTAPTRR
jgi:hypothetical protein